MMPWRASRKVLLPVSEVGLTRMSCSSALLDRVEIMAKWPNVTDYSNFVMARKINSIGLYQIKCT